VARWVILRKRLVEVFPKAKPLSGGCAQAGVAAGRRGVAEIKRVLEVDHRTQYFEWRRN
jgi:hypothetical protein